MIDTVQSVQFAGRVTSVGESDSFHNNIKNLVDRTVTVDLGDAGSVSFNYTALETGGLAFVKRGDLVKVTLGKFGASPVDVG
jgi:hypothetical protein